MVKRRTSKKLGFGAGRGRVAFISNWFAHTSTMENCAAKTKLFR
jgi:hypothetical protein